MENRIRINTAKNTVRESGMIGDIPVILEYGKSGGKKPVLFLCHGFGGCKEDFLVRAEELSEEGWMVVMPDNRHFGQRPGGGGMDYYLDKGKGYNVLRIRRGIKETADDISVIIDYLETHESADAGRIGMIGISMGGFLSFRALISDRRIGVIAPLISSPWWNDVPSDNLMYVENRKELDDYRQRFEPAGFPELFAGRPVFVQLGKRTCRRLFR